MKMPVYVVFMKDAVLEAFASEEEALDFAEMNDDGTGSVRVGIAILNMTFHHKNSCQNKPAFTYKNAIEAILNKREFTDVSKRSLMGIIFRNASSKYYELVVSIMEKSDSFFNARSFLETLNASEERK